MSEDIVRKLLMKNQAGLSKPELWKASKLSNKQVQATLNSMIRRKELLMHSGRVVLNNSDCLKALLLDISMGSIYSACNKFGIPKHDIKKEKMKAWIDTYVDCMEWKEGRLISKLKADIFDHADLHNIEEFLGK